MVEFITFMSPLAPTVYYKNRQDFGLPVNTQHMDCNEEEDSKKQ